MINYQSKAYNSSVQRNTYNEKMHKRKKILFATVTNAGTPVIIMQNKLQQNLAVQ